MTSQAPPSRVDPRLVTDIEATWSAGGQNGSALVYNISIGGCMLEASEDHLFPGQGVTLSLPQLPAVEGTVVWQDSRCAGVRFHAPIRSDIVTQLGFKEPEISFEQLLPRDRFGRMLPVLSGRLPF